MCSFFVSLCLQRTKKTLKINIRLYGLVAMSLLLISSCTKVCLKEKRRFIITVTAKDYEAKKADVFK